MYNLRGEQVWENLRNGSMTCVQRDARGCLVGARQFALDIEERNSIKIKDVAHVDLWLEENIFLLPPRP